MRSLERRYSLSPRTLSEEDLQLLDVLVKANERGSELELAGKPAVEIAQAVAAVIKAEAPHLPVNVSNGVVTVRFADQDMVTPIYPVEPHHSEEKPIHFA